MHMGIDYVSKQALEISEEVLDYLIESYWETRFVFLKIKLGLFFFIPIQIAH